MVANAGPERLAAHPGHLSCRKTERAKVLRTPLRVLVSRTERVLAQGQRVAEELLGLRLLATLPERGHKVGRRGQRALVLSAEEAGILDESLALDLRGLSVLALL